MGDGTRNDSFSLFPSPPFSSGRFNFFPSPFSDFNVGDFPRSTPRTGFSWYYETESRLPRSHNGASEERSPMSFACVVAAFGVEGKGLVRR